MKIIFFGTPAFAANSLKALINVGHNIVAIVCPPDSKKGRGKELKPCSVKEVGEKNNTPILQPPKLKNETFIAQLKSFNADLFVVVAFRMLPKLVWDLPKKGTINLHTSLLPNYRGAAPINWVLINGEKITGVTTFFINDKIDCGAIIEQEKVSLTNNTTAAELHNTLMNKGSELLISTLDLIKYNSLKPTPQENTKAILDAPKLTKQLLKIDWKNSAYDIHNLIRGLSPFLNNTTQIQDVAICPSAWFLLQKSDGKTTRIKVHLSKVVKTKSKNLLQIKTDNKTYLHIATSQDYLAILHLQPEGKRTMSIQEFLQGNNINEDNRIL